MTKLTRLQYLALEIYKVNAPLTKDGTKFDVVAENAVRSARVILQKTKWYRRFLK